jgi:CHASE2 domain-containing sensor protein
MHEDPNEDKNVVIVNLSEPPDVDRAEVAQMIMILNKYKPKIIAIDGFYRKLRKPAPDDTLRTMTVEDSLLNEAFAQTENLVLGTQFANYNDKKKEYDTLQTSNPLFIRKAKLGFVNLTTAGDANVSEFLTSRSFMPKVKCAGKSEVAFAVKIAEIYKLEKAKQFLARDNISEFINYKGNIGRGDTIVSKAKACYTTLDYFQVLGEEFEPSVVKDKIIILGYMGKNLAENDFTDKFYTPMNKNYVGKSTPDMYGVVVHANIVSMILDSDYIDDLNDWANFGIMVLASLLSVMLFSYFHQYLGYWYDAITILFQLSISLLLMATTVFAFHWYQLKIDVTLAIGAVVLSGIVVEIYYGLIHKIILRLRKKPSIKLTEEVK